MKLPLLTIALCLCGATAFSQKDKTSNWKFEEIYGGQSAVTTKSRVVGKFNYEAAQVIVTKEGKMRWKVTPLQQSSVQILVNATTIVNEQLEYPKKYELKVKLSDTVRVYFIAEVKEKSKASFFYEYIYGEQLVMDTAKIVLKKDPKQAFEQLLTDARFHYQHLFYSNEKDIKQDIQYPNGLFYKMRALKDRQWVKQYTAFAVDKAAADKNYAEWNKKVKAWLQDYNITSVTQTGDNYNTETNYIKQSTNGFPLFKVTVFINQDEKYYVGVIIAKS